jgi:hypothetical protein
MVDAERRGSVPTQGIEAHQIPVSRLVQRIMAQETLGKLDGGVIITLLFQKYDQTF